MLKNLLRMLFKKMMLTDKKVDDKQIDRAYSKINKDNEKYKALTIEILQ